LNAHHIKGQIERYSKLTVKHLIYCTSEKHNKMSRFCKAKLQSQQGIIRDFYLFCNGKYNFRTHLHKPSAINCPPLSSKLF